MRRRTALGWIAFFALVAAFGGGGLDALRDGDDEERRREAAPATAPEPGPRGAVPVIRVVDGDTIRVRLDGGEEPVRYIGIDTPETKRPGTPVECFGREASAANERLVGGERVRLRFDAERRDRFGRLLAYVDRARDGLFVNLALVRGGWATPLTIPPNVRHAERFVRAARAAREAGRGLWRAC